MKIRLLLGLAGIATIFGMLIYISIPAGHIPPYDANLVRLAESELQGYCAGESFWKSGGNGSGSIAKQCRSQRVKQKSDLPNVQEVPRAFCQAIVDMGWKAGTVAICEQILNDDQLWPTYDGSLSNQWNRARPYPGSLIILKSGRTKDNSRTGGHQSNTRNDSGMRGYP